MPVPDVYAKGQGHRPTMSVAGHFLGMHAPERPDVWKPEQLWYRGDEMAALRAECDKLMERSVGAMAIAEGTEGYENVPVDCPMLAAVAALRARLAENEELLEMALNDDRGVL
jgi:hypothetical protein